MAAVRVLAVFCSQKSEGVRTNGPLDELLSNPAPNTEVLVLRNATLQEVGEQILIWQPSIVYFSGETGRQPSVGKLPVLMWRPSDGSEGLGNVQEELALLFQGATVDTVYFDAPGCSGHADLVRTMGVPHVIFWAAASVNAPHAAHFSRAFFSGFREPGVSTSETFAVASQSTQAHCTQTLQGNHQVAPGLPQLLSDSTPGLPDMDSMPPPDIQGAHMRNGCMSGIPGWEHVRLLAPHAELRLLICGGSGLIDTKRLGALGLGIRALLVQEMRVLAVQSLQLNTKVPSHLPPGSFAVRCTVKSASGAEADVVLGGPKDVLEREEVVQLALRHTITADSLSLQLRLPPSGAPAPQPKSAAHVAFGSPVVDVIAVTSVWTISILRALCQDESFRGLVSLGIAAVGGSPVLSFNQTDAAHFSAFAPAISKPPAGRRAAAQPAWQRGSLSQYEPASREGSYERGWDGDEEARKRKKRQKSRLADEDADWGEGREQQPRQEIPYISNRRSIQECTESEWLEDYCSFCSSQLGRRVTPETWPDAVLNGIPLDVFNLYKEVVTRGGFGMGNGINWKGQIFPKMRNYTPSHKMTGIGNALKTKYQQLLLDYENAHPEDATTDRCAICGGGEEVSTDWVSCDRCETWVHFSCDERPDLGAFKDYAKTDGLSYICADCSG